MHISELFKKVRDILLLQQAEMATKLDVTRSAISHYEIGLRIPKRPVLRKFVKLAADAGIDIDWGTVTYD